MAMSSLSPLTVVFSSLSFSSDVYSWPNTLSLPLIRYRQAASRLRPKPLAPIVASSSFFPPAAVSGGGAAFPEEDPDGVSLDKSTAAAAEDFEEDVEEEFEEGDEEGFEEGDEEGFEEDDEEGDEEGFEEDDEEGDEEGFEEDDEEGFEEGDEEDFEEGDEEGFEEGDEEGFEEDVRAEYLEEDVLAEDLEEEEDDDEEPEEDPEEDPARARLVEALRIRKYVKSRLPGGFAAQEITATGQRKTAIARVVLQEGTGESFINFRDSREYLQGNPLWLEYIKVPLVTLGIENNYDIFVKAHGGGLSGQAQAICLGVARALLKINENYRVTLKAEGLLTRDTRIVERKKVGLKKARKAPQYSKR